MIATAEKERIESLDVLRGFALLGILLLNILGFGLVSTVFVEPGIYISSFKGSDFLAWAMIELTSEGVMRALFSILFGAGVVLFVSGIRAKSGWLHYRRTFWLLMFGLFDAYILLWSGDILVTYAVCGAILWLIRDWSPKRLMISSVVLVSLGVLQSVAWKAGLEASREASQLLESESMSGVQVDPEIQEWAQGWKEFESSLSDEASIQKEVNARGQSYLTAFKFNLTKVNEMILVALPFFLILDALMMMVIGMALYKYGILEGRRESGFYMRMVIAGFLIGLVFNAYEIWLSVSSKMDVVEANFLFRWSYHLGRLSMALGYLGLILWMIKSNWIESLRARLAAVGRMALTNYLMHSFFALLIFSGAGLGLIGKLSLVELYPIVLLIWIFQLALSPWWLEHFYFGPVEWLWRWLTYLERPKMRRKDSQFIGS
jgi:uncharacterized protein